MKKHRHISVNPVHVGANRIGNNKAIVTFCVSTPAGFTYYDVTLEQALIAKIAAHIGEDRPLSAAVDKL
jgi:hypothetical protein